MSNNVDEKKKKDNKSDYVVGIGASAGGLEALQKFLTALPANTGFPYIIVQHLSPDYKSLLSEILSKYTDMPVNQVEDGMKIEPDSVYVIQPGKNMRLSGGKLLLSSQREKELNLPIDLFFRSLAEDAGNRAIAIVLSGTGSDGSNGIKAIKENDGLILTQDPESSKFDGMPRSAIRTGLVDAVLEPEKIAMELGHISDAAKKVLPVFKTERQIDEDLLKKIYILLKKVCNINFTHYKQTTILRRIERRMMITHKETLTEYVELLYSSADEVKTLSKEVLIGVTSFFRDPEFFQTLKDKAIMDILVKSSEDEPIRVWSAGCSTGEEAYSVAMLFCEAMESLKIKRNIKIFATDLDVESVAIAGKGVYGDSIFDAVSPARLSRFFTKQNNSYVINRELRKMIIFSPHNVFQDPPFGKLDLILCRNMLIYFQTVLQNDLFSIFHASLKDGGYLFLGKSEAIGVFTEAFPVVDAVAKIFSHRADVRIAGAKAVPFLQTTFFGDDLDSEYDQKRMTRAYPTEINSGDEESIDSSLLEQFMPACVVINEKNEIVHSYGNSSNFIHFSVGRFSNILFDVLTEALKVPVSTLLKEAREKNARVQYGNLCVMGETAKSLIDITAMPISKRITETSSLYAVIFNEQSRGDSTNIEPFDIDRVASQRITDLEQSLGDVQSKLDRSRADQECVNEELQAANEELLTANEELQSSNEELQSVNEELYTVNSEYQQKLTELAELNDDIANFLSSTLIGIIFVDNKLNIRRYTDYVTSEFSVMDHDIGRSLKFISYHFPAVDISEICDNVLKTLVPDEREIVTSKNKVFFMRVAPYRSTENKILGCVITLVDVTRQKMGQSKLQTTEERLGLMQQANAASSDYLTKIVHEIRTPLGVLAGLSKLSSKTDDKQSREETLDKMAQIVDYMSALVTDIAEAAQNERLATTHDPAPFYLTDVTKNVYNLLHNSACEKGLSFDLTFADGFNPNYLGNATAIEQILVNFLNNAIKYTDKGGAVCVKAFETENSDDNFATLCFVISDTGRGIGKEFIPEMFKPFSREFPDDKNASKSMGLGLSIAYNLIKSMGGDVTVDSTVGVGTTFTILLHLKRCFGVDGDAERDYSDMFKELKNCTVLMAEDNSLNRMILGAILKSEGINYVEAVDGEEAVKLFVTSPPHTFDCILMDMKMPKMDGIKATMAIRDSKTPDAETIPIIAVSANGFAEDIKQAEKAGVNDYTTKPVDKIRLMTLMSKYIFSYKD